MSRDLLHDDLSASSFELCSRHHLIFLLRPARPSSEQSPSLTSPTRIPFGSIEKLVVGKRGGVYPDERHRRTDAVAMQALKDVALRLLNVYVSPYVENLNAHDLSVSVFGGEFR
jgi:hypothetical protein